jgi:hypothetical protein
MRDSGLWKYLPDDREEGAYGFSSFSEWLRLHPTISYSTGRTAMQAVELGRGLSLSPDELEGVDPSKFVDINPELRQILETKDIRSAALGSDPPRDELADIISDARHEALGWLESAKTLPRGELRRMRGEAVGWEFRSYHVENRQQWARIGQEMGLADDDGGDCEYEIRVTVKRRRRARMGRG